MGQNNTIHMGETSTCINRSSDSLNSSESEKHEYLDDSGHRVPGIRG